MWGQHFLDLLFFDFLVWWRGWVSLFFFKTWIGNMTGTVNCWFWLTFAWVDTFICFWPLSAYILIFKIFWINSFDSSDYSIPCLLLLDEELLLPFFNLYIEAFYIFFLFFVQKCFFGQLFIQLFILVRQIANIVFELAIILLNIFWSWHYVFHQSEFLYILTIHC